MSKKPKILIYDIETTPNLAYVWGKYQQDVIEYEKEWEILCFAYKWLGEKKVHTVRRRGNSDKSLVKKLWKLFDEADLVIAHNGNSFDQKKAKARFLVHGLNPPAGFAQVDTRLVARRYFKFNSNKLDDLGRYLGVGRKVKHGGFHIWLGCMANDKASWKKMLEYNIQDVKLLERVYMKLRPWIDNHPNLSLLSGDRKCPVCGSEKIQKNGTRATHRVVQQRYRCMSCGGSFTGPKKDNDYVD